jgi:hypothetical protein
LDVNELDELKVAADTLGRNCRIHLSKNSELEQRILFIINSELENISKSRIALEWAKKLKKDLAYAADIIKHFRTGILHTTKN